MHLDFKAHVFLDIWVIIFIVFINMLIEKLYEFALNTDLSTFNINA